MGGREVGSSGSGNENLADCNEHSNETSDSIKCGAILDSILEDSVRSN